MPVNGKKEAHPKAFHFPRCRHSGMTRRCPAVYPDAIPALPGLPPHCRGIFRYLYIWKDPDTSSATAARTSALAWTTVRHLIAVGIAAMAWFAAHLVAMRTLSPRTRPFALTTATALVLAALNAVNLCAPGWCGWYGFPLRYFTWSDSMGSMGAFRFGHPTFHPLGAVVDVSVAVTVCTMVFLHSRRSVPAAPVV